MNAWALSVSRKTAFMFASAHNTKPERTIMETALNIQNIERNLAGLISGTDGSYFAAKVTDSLP